MAFFTTSTDEENVKDYTGESSYINKSGFYVVVIKEAIVNESAKGSQSINLLVEYNGQQQVIYQAIRLTNNDGSVNLGQKLLNKLCIIVDKQQLGDPIPKTLPIGKGGEDVDCMIIEELQDIPIIMRIQMEYSMYEGKIREVKSIRNFFRYEDKATASEIVNNTEKGIQYKKEEQYQDKVTYKDGLTEEDVAQYLKDRRSNKNAETDKKPANGFGSKRTFGKKN